VTDLGSQTHFVITRTPPPTSVSHPVSRLLFLFLFLFPPIPAQPPSHNPHQSSSHSIPSRIYRTFHRPIWSKQVSKPRPTGARLVSSNYPAVPRFPANGGECEHVFVWTGGENTVMGRHLHYNSGSYTIRWNYLYLSSCLIV
jgi:hypothetical protein